jgi:nucleoprotein TPR
MATDIELRTISNFSSLPESTINGLLDAPTVDTVKSFLKSIEKQAKECEHSRSQKVRLEVELETVVRTNESKVKVLQNSRDKALADVQKLRSDVQSAENNRARVEADLEQVRSSNSSGALENASLKSRISSLEASNRDIVASLESKTTAYERLSQDLSASHQKSAELRKKITTLEESVQTANSAASSSKFREQSLQLEIEQLKKSNEWLNQERDIKAEEHKNFRKEKNARIAELSRSNEQYISEAEARKRSEAALKHRVEELSNKYEDSLQEIQRLQEERLSEAESHRIELEGTNRLAKLREEQALTAQDRV